LPKLDSEGGTTLSSRGAKDDVRVEPTRVEPLAFGFVEDIHVSSNTCRDVQACANTGSVSDEKSKNVQAHASLSKDFAGSLLDGMAADGEDGRSDRSLLSVRQVVQLRGVCPATVYRLCDGRELPHLRVLNAIRIDPRAVKEFMATARMTSSARHRARGRVRLAVGLVAKRPESDYSP
jgi:predicted DNA-binding transcriptional regulator AlpA